MDLGVMDTSTCTPMNNAFVEIWHGKSPRAFQPQPIVIGLIPLLANALGDYGAYPGGNFNRLQSWLRGGWYTDTNGMVEITTVYPGYYDGRAPHIHLMVHKDWSQSDNGFV